MKHLRLQEQYVPGEYRFRVSDDGKAYVLATNKGVDVDRGRVGDSVGRRAGFLWAPRAGSVPSGTKVHFRLDTPRDAASRLAKRLNVHMDPEGNFLRIELAGANPRRITEIVNAVIGRYVQVGAELKKEKVVQLTGILDEQLQFARKRLDDAETQYRTFRTRTITLPSDRPSADPRVDPVMGQFFTLQVERDQLRRDREAVQHLLTRPSDTTGALGSLASVAAVTQMSPDLVEALKELTAKQAHARELRYRFNDEYPPVKKALGDIATLQRQTIPALGASLIRDISVGEAELDRRLSTQTGQLRAIPGRSLEEERLRRNVEMAAGVFTNLQQRYDEARIEEASTTPDVRVLDPAVMPMQPAKNTAPFYRALLPWRQVSQSAATGAVVMDRLDPRVRYPDQVSRDMGLTILGAVPAPEDQGGPVPAVARRGRRGGRSPARRVPQPGVRPWWRDADASPPSRAPAQATESHSCAPILP